MTDQDVRTAIISTAPLGLVVLAWHTLKVAAFCLVVVAGLASCETAHQVPHPVVSAPLASVAVGDETVDAGASVLIEWQGVTIEPSLTLQSAEQTVVITLDLPLEWRGLEATGTLRVEADLLTETATVLACIDAPPLTVEPLCRESDPVEPVVIDEPGEAVPE